MRDFDKFFDQYLLFVGVIVLGDGLYVVEYLLGLSIRYIYYFICRYYISLMRTWALVYKVKGIGSYIQNSILIKENFYLICEQPN